MIFLQLIIFLIVLTFCLWSLLQAYLYGKKDKCKECLEEGYKLGREEVNAHLDAYRKNGGWSA